MNCPNCKQPAESKLVDGVEYIKCVACGFLRLEKDGSAVSIAEPLKDCGWDSSLGGQGCPVPVQEEDGTKTAEVVEQKPSEPVREESKQDVVAGPGQPKPAEPLDNNDDGGFDINIHIDVEDE